MFDAKGHNRRGRKLQERERRIGKYHGELLNNFEMRKVGLNPEIKFRVKYMA